MVLGMPVSILTPPMAMMVPVGVPAGRKKLPLLLVTIPVFSPASATPLPLAST